MVTTGIGNNKEVYTMKLSSHINQLRGMSSEQIDEIVNHYKDFASVEYDNRDLDVIAERYVFKNYSLNMMKKCLFWYLYNKQVPGLTGRIIL